MPLVEKHQPGDFCWIELAATDQGAAKKFYSELFAWTINDLPMGPNDFYTTFKIDGRDVGAAYTLRAEQRQQGVPPHWNLYVAVESADTAAARATELGAKLFAAPFDIFDVGRMAVLQDPTGAVFSVWQAKRQSGFGIKGVPGAFCVADLSTPDQEAASRFYEQLFGWRVGKEDEKPSHNYYHLFNHNEFIGGILPPAFRDPGAPAYWQIYLQVSDCDAIAQNARISARNSTCRRCRLKISDAWPLWRIRKALRLPSSNPCIVDSAFVSAKFNLRRQPTVAKRQGKKLKSSAQKDRRVTLDDLAHFTIKSITPMANQSLELTGAFTHLTGVRLSEVTDGTVGFLYVSRQDSVYLSRKEFDSISRTATFIAWPPPKSLREGETLPYVDRYWSPKEVSFALEPASAWKKVKFKAEDSVRFHDPKIPGWWTSHVASHPVPADATDVQVIKNGWDHEHCYFCKSRIGRAGNPLGYYSKADNDWLCLSCYKKFIARHDLRFVQFKT